MFFDNEILAEKEERQRAERKNFDLQNIVVRNLIHLKKDSPVAEWLLKSMQRSVYIGGDVVSFMKDKLEEIGDSNYMPANVLTLLDNAVANYVNEEIIPRSMYKYEPRTAQRDAFINHCFTRLYDCSPDEVTYVLVLDTTMISSWMGLMSSCQLNELSLTRTNESRYRTPNVSDNEREQSMRGFVALAQWLHPHHDAAYIRRHLRWEKITIPNIRASLISGKKSSAVTDSKTIFEMMLFTLERYLTYIADA